MKNLHIAAHCAKSLSESGLNTMFAETGRSGQPCGEPIRVTETRFEHVVLLPKRGKPFVFCPATIVCPKLWHDSAVNWPALLPMK